MNKKAVLPVLLVIMLAFSMSQLYALSVPKNITKNYGLFIVADAVDKAGVHHLKYSEIKLDTAEKVEKYIPDTIYGVDYLTGGVTTTVDRGILKDKFILVSKTTNFIASAVNATKLLLTVTDVNLTLCDVKLVLYLGKDAKDVFDYTYLIGALFNDGRIADLTNVTDTALHLLEDADRTIGTGVVSYPGYDVVGPDTTTLFAGKKWTAILELLSDNKNEPYGAIVIDLNNALWSTPIGFIVVTHGSTAWFDVYGWVVITLAVLIVIVAGIVIYAIKEGYIG